MARIRSVHPGLFSDEAFVSCSHTARLMLIGIWTDADDKGIFPWKPLSLKMRLFPADSLAFEEIEALLAELLEANIIKRFDADGKTYGAVRNFRKFQRPKKPNDVHPLPQELIPYVGLNAGGSVSVGNQFGIGAEKSIQREDGGGRREDGGGNNNRHIHEEKHHVGFPGDDDFADSDGVIHEHWDNEEVNA
jgi:hypothetical protein